MQSPIQVIQSNPKRDRESPQGYALRVLTTAHQVWVSGIYELARNIAYTEGEKGKTADARDMASNIAIEIEQQKLLVVEALHLPGRAH